MPPKAKQSRKRMGKKHRSADTRPRKGRNPKSASDAAKAGKKAAAAKNPKPSPSKKAALTPEGDESDWRVIDPIDEARVSAATNAADTAGLPLIAVCGRPNVGKSTLFNRLTHSRRSIVGDEPGITRDRIYGEVEWQGERARLVDTGGVVPDDEALIPAEIFRQAQVALEEADAIIMVVDGRTELAAPDIELARLLLRGGKPVFLAVNKMDTEAMEIAGRELPPPRLPQRAAHLRRARQRHRRAAGRGLCRAARPQIVAKSPSRSTTGAGRDRKTSAVATYRLDAAAELPHAYPRRVSTSARPRSPSSAAPTWARARC